MFYFNPYEQEIDFTDDDILHMIFGFVIFEFDVETILDSHLHLDCVVDVGGGVAGGRGNIN